MEALFFCNRRAAGSMPNRFFPLQIFTDEHATPSSNSEQKGNTGDFSFRALFIFQAGAREYIIPCKKEPSAAQRQLIFLQN